MPGLRVFRCLRPPFVRRVKIGPSLAKVPLDLALCRDRAPARADRRATTWCTRTKRAPRSASCSRALLGVPHLYDMHSSLPQQLGELRLQPLARCCAASSRSSSASSSGARGSSS